ncbi:MAG: hypothetical protein WAX89_02095 [Alphaproteobacteria bacterium]
MFEYMPETTSIAFIVALVCVSWLAAGLGTLAHMQRLRAEQAELALRALGIESDDLAQLRADFDEANYRIYRFAYVQKTMAFGNHTQIAGLELDLAMGALRGSLKRLQSAAEALPS